MSEINGINFNQINSVESASLDKAERVDPTASSSTAAQDAIQLSSEAEQLQRIEQYISELPDMDKQRVLAIQQDIQQGQYQVNATSLADNMIRLEESLRMTEK